jgi:hypothetical protein
MKERIKQEQQIDFAFYDDQEKYVGFRWKIRLDGMNFPSIQGARSYLEGCGYSFFEAQNYVDNLLDEAKAKREEKTWKDGN